MVETAFDPTEAVTFDLAFGHIHLDGAPNRVMVPAEALVKICAASGEEATATLADAIGEAMGRRVGVRLAGGSDEAARREAVRGAGLERVTSELAGELAVAGYGALAAERWGKALVLAVEQPPFGPEGDALLAGVLEGAMRAMVGGSLGVAVLTREAQRVRFLVIGASSIDAVRARLDRGEPWGAVLAALQPEAHP